MPIKDLQTPIVSKQDNSNGSFKIPLPKPGKK